MPAFENAVRIARPVQEVFTYLADAENLPQWNYAIEQRPCGPSHAIGCADPWPRDRFQGSCASEKNGTELAGHNVTAGDHGQ
jgi:uncharacterized protein YndB with AHSA1/START domain